MDHLALTRMSQHFIDSTFGATCQSNLKIAVIGGHSAGKEALLNKILNQTVAMPVVEAPVFKSLAELKGAMDAHRFAELYMPPQIKNDVACVKINATNYAKLKEVAIVSDNPKLAWHAQFQILTIDNTPVFIDDDIADDEGRAYYRKHGGDMTPNRHDFSAVPIKYLQAD